MSGEARPLVARHVWVAIGPSGAGKTSLGERLAVLLAAPFVEGDLLHPEANIAKMRSGVPLNDEDRRPWLDAVARLIRDRAREGDLVISCSALKRAYRDRLRAESGDARPLFLCPHVDEPTLAARLQAQRHDYFPPSLLASQLEAFQRPNKDENVLWLPSHCDADALAAFCIRAMSRG